jgi:O-antigen/teichoic acid export membrane protein
MLVGTRLITDVTEPSDFGSASLLLGVVGLAYGTTCGPLTQAALRHYPDLQGRTQIDALRRAVLAVLKRWMIRISAGMLALAAAVAATHPDLLPAWFIATGLLAVESVRGVAITFLNAARRQAQFAVWIAAEGWARPIAAASMVAIAGSSTAALMLGYLLGTAGVLATYLVLGRTTARDSLRLGSRRATDGGIEHRLTHYASPLVPLAVVGWTSGLADRYLIGGLVGLEAAGVYAAVYGLVSRPFLMVGATVELVLRQPYYEAVSRADRQRERVILVGWTGLVVGVSLLGLVCTLLWSEPIAGLLLGEPFRSGAFLMPWIAAGYTLLVTAQVLERVCYAHRTTGLVLAIQTVGAVLCIVIASPAIAAFGLAGAAVAVPAYFGGQLAAAGGAAWTCLRRSSAR